MAPFRGGQRHVDPRRLRRASGRTCGGLLWLPSAMASFRWRRRHLDPHRLQQASGRTRGGLLWLPSARLDTNVFPSDIRHVFRCLIVWFVDMRGLRLCLFKRHCPWCVYRRIVYKKELFGVSRSNEADLLVLSPSPQSNRHRHGVPQRVCRKT
ncbi:hypothetical protein FR483_n838R [Paramecium bursaria Chlorella virus FR483]|uniref:Uncharacterized protein n838R n=1 Tax=Paramecium bursaria Chlorella virus FR483 TaxID=399781 RepID=A7J8J2_PBCVF|nr:hypothetical protein FR483_n838R [Paramecium bursaria Chlorella virus FR483]ABT16123.1 hypothetical protein FR483_n838R [Paramecium bursaria Chlorella virus FR483]